MLFIKYIIPSTKLINMPSDFKSYAFRHREHDMVVRCSGVID